MSRLWHAVLHGLVITAQYGTLASSYVPPKYQPVTVASLALVQAILALSQHKAGK